MLRRPVLAARLTLVLAPAAFAQARSDGIDDYVTAEMQRQRIPGICASSTSASP